MTMTSFKIDHLSPSQFDEYLKCPKFYEYKRVDGLPESADPTNLNLEFGGVFHKIIEKFYRNKLAGQVVSKRVVADGFEILFDRALIKAEKHTAENKTQINLLKKKGVILICKYLDEIAKHVTPLHVEQELFYDLDGVKVTNRIDSILQDEEDYGYFDDVKPVIIEDYKTSSQLYTDDEIIANLQLKSYAYAIEKNYPQYKVAKIRYIVFVKGSEEIQVLELPLYENWQTDFLQQALNIKRGIEQRIFYRNPYPKAYKCKSYNKATKQMRVCPFYEMCWHTSPYSNLVNEKNYK